MRTVQDYLKIVDGVIARGKFKDDWESLSAFKIPSWYREGRFGLFIHWGAYSVPATESEWYPRQTYIKGTRSCAHRLREWGEKCEYRDIVAKFKPTRFDAEEWLSIFEKSGAKYIMPVAEHHDGVKMYESELNEWNMKNLNGRDYIMEIKEACERHNLTFLTSSHRAEHFWFFNGARKFFPHSEISQNLYPELYGPAYMPENGNVGDMNSFVATKEWMEDWLASSCELIDRTRPSAIYFDWWIQRPEFKPYVKKFLAYYYNRSEEWGKEVAVFYKWGAVMNGCAVFDVERGQTAGILPQLWQNDTAIAKNSWGYTENNNFKTPYEVAVNLIDVVSKNGCFMLNVGPKSDGTICEEEKRVLLDLGKWLEKNGEAIYGSKPFENGFGEGRTKRGGSFRESVGFKRGDYRFTYKTGAVYVFAMGKAHRGEYGIKSLRFANEGGIRYTVKSVVLLGSDAAVNFSQDKKALTLRLSDVPDGDMPLCFKVEVD